MPDNLPIEDKGTGVVETPAVETPAVETPAVVTEGEKKTADPKPVVVPPKPDWRDVRLAQVTAARRKAESDLADANARLAAIPKGEVETEVKPKALTEDDVNARAEVIAQNRAMRKAFDDACNAVAAKGIKDFGADEFTGRVRNLQQLKDNSDPLSVRTYDAFLLAVTETGAGEKIIHALGDDLNEAARIMAMPPIKMAVYLAKMADKLEAGTDPSGLPKPIVPVGDRGRSHEKIDPRDPDRSDKLTTKEWMERRQAQADAAGNGRPLLRSQERRA